jgi:hypothetical protein
MATTKNVGCTALVVGLAAFGVWLAMASSPVPLAAQRSARLFAERPAHLKTGVGIHRGALQADGTWLAMTPG